jgi:hypothetical protein
MTQTPCGEFSSSVLTQAVVLACCQLCPDVPAALLTARSACHTYCGCNLACTSCTHPLPTPFAALLTLC